MNDEHRYAIPAASIGDTDLVAIAQTDPGAAKEIERLVAQMDQGEETREEFLRLCQLLFDVGSTASAEYLLRRNLDHYEGQVLYARLFGTTKQEEFKAAIEAFKRQFDLELVLAVQKDFLVSSYYSAGGPPRFDAFALLSKPCEIKFGYIEREKIEADISLLDPAQDVFAADECLFMFFVNGVWEIAGSTDD